MKPYYERGGVTIYHGDCLDLVETFYPLYQRTEMPWPHLLLTDPPYGIRLRSHKGSGWHVRNDDDQSYGNRILDRFGTRPRVVFAHPFRPWAGIWQQYLVWDKGAAVGGGGHPPKYWKYTWELIQVADVPRLHGPRDSAVLRFPVTPANSKLHPCAKPVALMRYLLEKTTEPGALVLDPFAGLGATLVAALETDRRAIGMEIEERYCEIAAKRLDQLPLPLGA